MTFVFWQGIISIHQQSFLEALAAQSATTHVLLVVEQDISAYRRDMGWDVPSFTNVEVVRSPSPRQIKDIVTTHKDAIHIMGGIRVGAMLSTAFDECIKAGCRFGIMTEPYNDAGLKGRLRTLKYRYYRLRYFRHIQFVLAIGRQGVQQYAALGFPPDRIFPWAYFISVPDAMRTNSPSADVQRIMYAGRLEPAKGILRFTQELVKTSSTNYTLDIYGEGTDGAQLKQLIANHDLQDRIKLHPFMPYAELVKEYARYDWMVLPSAGKDGWGVVVSEGLLYGLKVLCSSICGVSRVVKEGENGLVFHWHQEDSCGKAIATMLSGHAFATPAAISGWAQRGISAAAGAAYLQGIIHHLYHHEKKPDIPWEQNI